MSEESQAILVRGGRILDPGRGVDSVGDVLVKDGRIAAVGERIDGQGARVIDAKGLVVCPGLVDIHCHLRDPGFEYKETIETGTRAAARGGFTTVCCMPNTNPPIDSRATVEYIQRTAATTASARVLPVGCVSKGRCGEELAEMGDLADAGVVAFSDDGSPVANAELMRRALEYSRALGLPVSDHCQDPTLAHNGVMHEGWVAARLGLRGEPAAAEETMVARDIALAELTGAHVHIAHVSAAGSVELVRQAKARGVHVTAEATPHHLTLTHELVMSSSSLPDGLAYDTNAKVAPSLRTADDIAACVEGLRDGTIDAIATDHAPHAPVDKLCEFDDAPSGIVGFETALALMLSLVHEGKIDLPTLLHRMTAGPVAAFALERIDGLTGLGSLAVGAPGDVLVFDPNAEWTVDPESFASKGRNTPLAGHALKGQAVATIFGGHAVFLKDRAEV
ncbi:MAG: dihydroorotase [Dehalococcoidia bacterium]|jgi:dihydroorotase